MRFAVPAGRAESAGLKRECASLFPRERRSPQGSSSNPLRSFSLCGIRRIDGRPQISFGEQAPRLKFAAFRLPCSLLVKKC